MPNLTPVQMVTVLLGAFFIIGFGYVYFFHPTLHKRAPAKPLTWEQANVLAFNWLTDNGFCNYTTHNSHETERSFIYIIETKKGDKFSLYVRKDDGKITKVT